MTSDRGSVSTKRFYLGGVQKCPCFCWTCVEKTEYCQCKPPFYICWKILFFFFSLPPLILSFLVTSQLGWLFLEDCGFNASLSFLVSQRTRPLARHSERKVVSQGIVVPVQQKYQKLCVSQIDFNSDSFIEFTFSINNEVILYLYKACWKTWSPSKSCLCWL